MLCNADERYQHPWQRKLTIMPPAAKSSRAVLAFSCFVVIVAGCSWRVHAFAAAHAISGTGQGNGKAISFPPSPVVHPTPRSLRTSLVLPGTMQAYVESPIYARTNGYLKKWYHDIGSRVRQGELLAEIDTPEVDQQLIQAKADLDTGKANANLSKITATRYRGTDQDRRRLQTGSR